MPDTSFETTPHRRHNPLTKEWVLISPQRNKRPWQGHVENTAPLEKPNHDPTCFLCPGNTRVNGAQNPDYSGPFVFPNDFPALLEDTQDIAMSSGALMVANTVRGTARVICFSERHDLTLPEMTENGIRRVVNLWAEQCAELGKTYKYVAIFENKGAIMGCSNPHPHGQIWASDFIPNEVAREDANQLEYHQLNDQNLLVTYAEQEARDGIRTVVSNEHWIAVVPYWATWPYEVLLMPKRHVQRLPDLTPTERDALSSILKRLCTRYDNLFETEFPYTMGWHAAPNGAGNTDHWQLHAHFYPPLLRSATVRKFMVGYEMLAESQRDLTAETAAAHLRDQSEVHYKIEPKNVDT